MNPTSTPAPATFVTQGNGTAVHVARPSSMFGTVAACDAWAGTAGGGRVARIRTIAAVAATCKRCIKIEAAG